MPAPQLTADARLTETLEVLKAEVANNELLAERLAELELAIDDVGWARLSLDSEWEFSRDGLDRIIALSRLMTIKNPLIHRAVTLKADYVFGQGIEISARDDDINELVLQPFLDDPANHEALFSDVAFPEQDQAFTTDGNFVSILFPNRYTGHVGVRPIDINEIRDVVTNPDDRTEVWFYKRCWTERLFALDGAASGFRTAQREAWYPDWRFQPRGGQRVESIDRIAVRWDTPIYHRRVGGLAGMRFGVPEFYSAFDWATAYKLFLEDWATIVRSLSRFAWAVTVKKNPTAAARKLGTTVTRSEPRETNPSPTTGAAFTGAEGTSISPIPKTDATIASEDGVWLAKMVSAGTGIPYTILMGDPDMGNLATAKTLDRPTELAMIRRQRVWAEIVRDLCGYAIDWAIRAPGGKLTGREETGPDGKTRWVVDDATVDGETVTGADRRTVDVTFPPIIEENILEMMKAIVLAEGTELPPPEVILRLILTVLGVDDIDELVAALPERLELRKAEQQAQFEQGQDPRVRFGQEDDGPES